MRLFTTLADAIKRRRLITRWRREGRRFYFCHLAHPNDRIAAQALSAYFKWVGVDLEVIEFNPSGQRPELNTSLDDKTIAVIGVNSQLDHSWIGDESFIALAARRNIPVIQWILDHPSLRWPAFENNLDAANVRYVFVSRFCEQYFRRYAVPGARTATAICAFTRLSRADDLSWKAFIAREIHCLIPLNLRRLGGTADELEVKLRELEPRLAEAVREAIETTRFDLVSPLVSHLERALARRGIEVPDKVMHVCAALVEDMTHIWRRRRVFEVAARFPVMIQTDLPPPDLVAKRVATFRSTPDWTDPKATLERMKSCRAVLSLSLTNDALHDRVGNAVNAGCVPVVEDNIAHRRVFKPDKSALVFRFDDDSLERCLDLVCHQPGRAYDIARRSTVLRDDPTFRFSGCDDLLKLAR